MTRPPISAIESAVLNIGTAANDCASARDAWIDENWNDATMWISNAIAQLESARAKIYAHQERLSENDKTLATGGVAMHSTEANQPKKND